jgi:hypothetical protein
MRLAFNLRDLPGQVGVEITPNQDPEALGCRPAGRGFPVCVATISYAGRGYAAMLGWIQVVRSTDRRSAGAEFELDPYGPLGSLSHPFCWFGLAPTLFDAPSRPTRQDLSWTAHSFLCFIAQPRKARAILGFSWGFEVREGSIMTESAAAIAPATWDSHLPLLRSEYPTWQFASGYHHA